jgi:hypothetical protein
MAAVQSLLSFFVRKVRKITKGFLLKAKKKTDEAKAEALLAAACNFQAQTLKSREACHEQYRRAELSERNSFRITIDGEIASLAMRFSNQTVTANQKISYQLAIFTSYVRTHFIINDLIMDGDVIEALTLIRRHIEALARLNEIDSKPLQDLLRQTPNVRNVLNKGSGPIYGWLSEIAHSAPRAMDLLGVVQEGERIGASLTSVYSESLNTAFDVHWFFSLYFLAWVVEKFPGWYPGYDNSEDKALLQMIFHTALRMGIIQHSLKENKQQTP